TLDPHPSALSPRDGIAPGYLVHRGELTRSAVGSYGHGDGDAPGLVVGEVGSPRGEGVDVVCHYGGLVPGEAGHLAVGGGDVTDSEDGGLPRHLEGGANLDEPIRAASGDQCVSEVVAVGHDAVAAEPDVGRGLGSGF